MLITQPGSSLCKQLRNLHWDLFNLLRNSGNKEAKSDGWHVISGRLNPGVSARSDPFPIAKSSTCLVVCTPLFNFFETDPVGNAIVGIKWLIKLVFPTPEGPASTVNFVFLNRSINKSMPWESWVDTGIQS